LKFKIFKIKYILKLKRNNINKKLFKLVTVRHTILMVQQLLFIISEKTNRLRVKELNNLLNSKVLVSQYSQYQLNLLINVMISMLHLIIKKLLTK